MFHLIFPFTQSTSNWCQLPAGSAFYTLRCCCLPDATRTFRARSVSCALRSACRRLSSCRSIVGSNFGHADWPPTRRLADCFGFSQQQQQESEREGGKGGRVRATKNSPAWQQSETCVVIVSCCCCYIYFSYCLSLCFSLFWVFDRGTLALIRSCWYCR